MSSWPGYSTEKEISPARKISSWVPCSRQTYCCWDRPEMIPLPTVNFYPSFPNLFLFYYMPFLLRKFGGFNAELSFLVDKEIVSLLKKKPKHKTNDKKCYSIFLLFLLRTGAAITEVFLLKNPRNRIFSIEQHPAKVLKSLNFVFFSINLSSFTFKLWFLLRISLLV